MSGWKRRPRRQVIVCLATLLVVAACGADPTPPSVVADGREQGFGFGPGDDERVEGVARVQAAGRREPGRRLALVIGNDAYSSMQVLLNATNDARSVTAALESVGFAVETVLDATRSQLTAALVAFARTLRSDDVALVYFAGHGVQVGGVNYLLPTDFVKDSPEQLRLDGVSAVEVEEMLLKARVAILMLDACRNNPFPGTRSAGSRGLAPMEARGTLIAYAAAAGQVALDGVQGAANGLFTSKFVEALQEPGLEVTSLFRRVRQEVYAASNGTQFPALYDGLLSDFVFREPGPEPADVVGSPSEDVPVVAMLEQENLFWESIVDSEDPLDFEAYLSQFPSGVYAPLARNRAAALRQAAEDAERLAAQRRAEAERRAAEDAERLAAQRQAEAERRAPGTVFQDCDDCPELVVIPSGRFRMGCVSGRDCRDDERPVHQVEVSSFALGKYEVTFEEYERFSRATGRNRPNDRGWGRGGRPVINVSLDDGVAYVAWLSEQTGEEYRLPSESEWEYAARAGTTTWYSWGQDIGRNRANCGGCGSNWDNEQTAPVGSFAANAWGLHDMHGNVWEWVADCWHENYAQAPGDGTAWTRGVDCGHRVLRGGSWFIAPVNLRSANRGRNIAGVRNGNIGFRVVRTLD